MNVDVIDVGENVLCDYCNDDYTGKADSGGLIVSGYGVCPKCEKRCRAGLADCGETKYIEAECPAGVSFQRFILDYRGGDNTIRIIT